MAPCPIPRWPDLAIIVLCLYTFLANVIMLNLIITLMGDLYAKIKEEQQLVFLRNRADLILEVESTMQSKDMNSFRNIPPYLHLLRPVNLEVSFRWTVGVCRGGVGGAVLMLHGTCATGDPWSVPPHLCFLVCTLSPVCFRQQLQV